ncbi:GTP-binding protein GEM [Engraulis encrasicolus]|uniref:GTP-binding protein GEM n=1 Tax=Engraulis encrasicolus TaxID=184585 RepID=UPI002FD48A71
MALLANMRRHSLRMQQHLHRWSICVADGSHLVSEGLKRCEALSSIGKPEDEKYNWASLSRDSGISTELSNTQSFTAMILGDPGVGKTALAGIFAGATDNFNIDTDLFEGMVCERTVLVDGESTAITLIDSPCYSLEEAISGVSSVDAFLLVYSITDRGSFDRAAELRIQILQNADHANTPIILVGNKCDLVRCREIPISEARLCAVVFDCKLVETSALMQHNVWLLFNGVVRQLRLRGSGGREGGGGGPGPTHRKGSLPQRAKRLIHSLAAMGNTHAAYTLKSKSCHDLSVL